MNSHWLRNPAIFLFALACATTGSAATEPAEAEKDLVSTWLVRVEGDSRTRTLRVNGVASKADGGLLLDARYGFTDAGQGTVKAEATKTPKGYSLRFVTQADTVVVAEQTDGGAFVGSFTEKSGAVKNVRLERISDDELAKVAKPKETLSDKSCDGERLSRDGTSTAANAQLVDKPRIARGDCWTFRVFDLWKREEREKVEHRVTGVGGDNVELRRTVLSSSDASNVGRRTSPRADAATWTFLDARIVEGKYVAFEFPLTVGKNWSYQFKSKGANGDTTQVRKARVEGWETIEVPAGSFNALKVVHTGQWNRWTPDGAFSGNVSETFWYAPDVKWWVKREYQDRTPRGDIWDHVLTELVGIRVQGP